MCEPMDDWPCKFDENLNLGRNRTNISSDQTISKIMQSSEASLKVENDFSYPSEPLGTDDDDEVTESKIRDFLDEKVLLCT